MKRKFYWVALLASAAMIAQANAGGHHGGGGSSDGSVTVSPSSNSGRSSAGPSYHAIPGHTLGGGRVIYSGTRLAPAGVRSASSTVFRPRYVYANAGASTDERQFRPSSISRSSNVVRPASESRTTINARHAGAGTFQFKNQNVRLRADWRNHVFAQRSASWQHNWDRGSDHWWRGHRCHFVNDSWIIFDFGFYPWDTFWYPYGNYYGYGYYPYSYNYGYNYDPGYYDSPVYDPGYYDSRAYSGEQYDTQDNEDVTLQSADSIVANAQAKLAGEGYYRGKIDGILGRETSRAIARFQSDQGLRVTGVLTHETIEALRLERVASY